MFCFLIKIQKRLDTILRWVQYYVAQTSLSEGPLLPVPEILQMNHLLSQVTSQMRLPTAQRPHTRPGVCTFPVRYRLCVTWLKC